MKWHERWRDVERHKDTWKKKTKTWGNMKSIRRHEKTYRDIERHEKTWGDTMRNKDENHETVLHKLLRSFSKDDRNHTACPGGIVKAKSCLKPDLHVAVSYVFFSLCFIILWSWWTRFWPTNYKKRSKNEKVNIFCTSMQ